MKLKKLFFLASSILFFAVMLTQIEQIHALGESSNGPISTPVSGPISTPITVTPTPSVTPISAPISVTPSPISTPISYPQNLTVSGSVTYRFLQYLPFNKYIVVNFPAYNLNINVVDTKTSKIYKGRASVFGKYSINIPLNSINDNFLVSAVDLSVPPFMPAERWDGETIKQISFTNNKSQIVDFKSYVVIQIPNRAVVNSLSKSAEVQGKRITIKGKNFSPNAAENIVYVGGIKANQKLNWVSDDRTTLAFELPTEVKLNKNLNTQIYVWTTAGNSNKINFTLIPKK